MNGQTKGKDAGYFVGREALGCQSRFIETRMHTESPSLPVFPHCLYAELRVQVLPFALPACMANMLSNSSLTWPMWLIQLQRGLGAQGLGREDVCLCFQCSFQATMLPLGRRKGSYEMMERCCRIAD